MAKRLRMSEEDLAASKKAAALKRAATLAVKKAPPKEAIELLKEARQADPVAGLSIWCAICHRTVPAEGGGHVKVSTGNGNDYEQVADINFADFWVCSDHLKVARIGTVNGISIADPSKTETKESVS